MATNAGVLCAVGNARGGVFERQTSMAIETPACSGTVVSAIYRRTREKNGKSNKAHSLQGFSLRFYPAIMWHVRQSPLSRSLITSLFSIVEYGS